MNLNFLTIQEALKALKTGQFSCLELVDLCLRKIKKKNKGLNVFLSIFEEEAREGAKKIDKKIKSKAKLGRLAGIPLAIKDNILVKDKTCTAGSKILKDYQATYEATVIKKLKAEGAIILGKTNLDEFGMGSSTENSAFGPTKNPFDLTRVAGGSSGGSAVAVAADMALGALGSDTGGSIRQPAAFCGLVGLKPTYGLVSRFGLIAMASSLDQIGPLAKNVDDTALLLSVMEGKDDLDSTSFEPQFKILLPVMPKIQNFKIGVIKEFLEHRGLAKEVKNLVKKIMEKISQKIVIKEVSLPSLNLALACYYIIMPAEVSANLARYDGIRYGASKIKEKDFTGNLEELYFKTRSENFGPEVQRRIMLGTFVLSSGYRQAYYQQAQLARRQIKKEFLEVFKKVDFLVCPTTPTPAFKLGEKIKDPLEMYLSDIFTVPANLADLPAISLPIGKINGLPVGLQIMAGPWQENKLFSFAKAIEVICS